MLAQSLMTPLSRGVQGLSPQWVWSAAAPAQLKWAGRGPSRTTHDAGSRADRCPPSVAIKTRSPFTMSMGQAPLQACQGIKIINLSQCTQGNWNMSDLSCAKHLIFYMAATELLLHCGTRGSVQHLLFHLETSQWEEVCTVYICVITF